MLKNESFVVKIGHWYGRERALPNLLIHTYIAIAREQPSIASIESVWEEDPVSERAAVQQKESWDSVSLSPDSTDVRWRRFRHRPFRFLVSFRNVSSRLSAMFGWYLIKSNLAQNWTIFVKSSGLKSLNFKRIQKKKDTRIFLLVVQVKLLRVTIRHFLQ